MYTIRFRHDCNLLDIAWSGLFTEETVAAYAREVTTRFAAEGFRPGYRLRMDMTQSGVQPRAALDLFKARFGDFPKASRIAIVTTSALSKMQVLRVMTQPYLRVFDEAGPALDWLLEHEAVA